MYLDPFGSVAQVDELEIELSRQFLVCLDVVELLLADGVGGGTRGDGAFDHVEPTATLVAVFGAVRMPLDGDALLLRTTR